MNTLKINQTVKKEETVEREITLPFHYRSVSGGSTYLVKLLDESRAVAVYLTDHEAVASLSAISTQVALNVYPITEPVTEEQFVDEYRTAALRIKQLADPDMILSPLTDEERNEFPYSY